MLTEVDGKKFTNLDKTSKINEVTSSGNKKRGFVDNKICASCKMIILEFTEIAPAKIMSKSVKCALRESTVVQDLNPTCCKVASFLVTI